jgi:hypothetical protein
MGSLPDIEGGVKSFEGPKQRVSVKTPRRNF